MSFVLGLPRMHKEEGERRDFLPELVKSALVAGCEVQLERGVGTRMGLEADAYETLPGKVSWVDAKTAWRADLVLVLRSPEVEDYARLLRPKSTVVSMFHFPTRPRRVAKLRELGVFAVSLDSLTDDAGVRLVENTPAVGWNGLEAAFEALERFSPWRLAPGAEPVRVTVLGTGLVGRHAVDAATKYGSRERFAAWSREGRPPVLVTSAGRGFMSEPSRVRQLLHSTEVLVDASARADTSVPLVPNAWLGELPQHAVLCDLVVDPYVLAANPRTVRSIEGIPRGDLDQFIFAVNDARWSTTVPPSITQSFRRPVVSCYSWPGVHPRACMERYGRQLAPLLERLIGLGGAGKLERGGDALSRALWRASLRGFLERGA